MARKCFYSFHFKPDCWRAATVRQIGAIEGNEPASDNDWEAITSGTGAARDTKIERWISNQMAGKTCTIVLVGAETASRKWINHEIVKSWQANMGIVGIRIHGLKNNAGQLSSPGANPFDHINFGSAGAKLSSIVKCYNPAGADSKARYDWICQHLANAVEEAIKIRAKYT